MNQELFDKVKAAFDATNADVLFVTSDGQCFHKSGPAANHGNTLAREGADGGYQKIFSDQLGAIETAINAPVIEEEVEEPTEEVVEAPEVEEVVEEPTEEVVEAPEVEEVVEEPTEEVVEAPVEEVPKTTEKENDPKAKKASTKASK